MGKYSTAQLDKVVLLMLDGMGAAEARHKVGVSHTPAELHVFKFQWLVAGMPEPGKGKWQFTKSLVCYLRFEAMDDRGKIGWGIGKIMVALDATEGQVRKAIREGANVDDRGHRTGKGGRFFEGNSELYAEELRTEGTRLALGSELSHTEQARMARFAKLELAELKALATDWGVEVPRGTTKVKLAKLLATA